MMPLILLKVGQSIIKVFENTHLLNDAALSKCMGRCNASLPFWSQDDLNERGFLSIVAAALVPIANLCERLLSTPWMKQVDSFSHYFKLEAE